MVVERGKVVVKVVVMVVIEADSQAVCAKALCSSAGVFLFLLIWGLYNALVHRIIHVGQHCFLLQGSGVEGEGERGATEPLHIWTPCSHSIICAGTVPPVSSMPR